MNRFENRAVPAARLTAEWRTEGEKHAGVYEVATRRLCEISTA